MVSEPIYDPAKTYQDNFDHGPFGMFADPAVLADPEPPQHTFLGFPIHLPFGIPAGPLLNGNYVKAALDKGYDLPVYKTVRTRAYPCHAWPNVLPVDVTGDLTSQNTSLTTRLDYDDPLSITNSFGVPSFDPDFWQQDIASAVSHARPGQVVIASFQGTKPQSGGVTAYLADFALGARLLKQTGVKIVEVNLSCPNEGTSNLLCFDTVRSREVVEVIQRELDGVPLIIKCAYFPDNAKLSELVDAVAPFVAGITCINTISAEVRDSSGGQALPGEGRLWSGVCGAGIRWAGLDMVARLAQLRNDRQLGFAIIGCGGVTRASDYELYRDAGADAVMSATGVMWRPQLTQEIKSEQILAHGKSEALR
jgi:dihydroorotate dehydrogenase (NAD+) catalytic subunit